MAARKASPRRTTRKASSNGGSWLGMIVLVAVVFSIGVGSGYIWRSYLPLALPFESRLVSDGSSSDIDPVTQEKVTKEWKDRALSAEKEKDRLTRELEKSKEQIAKTERELGDLKIKNVLQSREN